MSDPGKPYELTFTEYPDFLYVNLSAERISEEIIASYVAEIVEKCDATEMDRILLHRDIPQVMPDGSVFHTVADSIRAFHGKKLALVNPHEHLDTGISFGITVGKNRGGNYASFKTDKEAIEWLLK